MAKMNRVTTNGTTYELQDYELNDKLSGFSGIVKNAGGTLSQAVAGTDYDFPILKGSGAPDPSKGSIGQRYVNTSATETNGLTAEYICTDVNHSTDGPTTCTWVAVGSLGDSLSVIADVYSPSSTYDIGDAVVYNGELYKCTVTISSGEAWNASHWTSTTVEALINSIQNAGIPVSQKGVANGVATLGADGKVPSSQLSTTGGHVVSSSEPSNTSLLWVDTGNSGILKYYNGSSWVPVPAVWGANYG